MCKTYGYCRISTKKQSIERQERNIKAAYPDAIITKEEFTGTKLDGRKGLDRILKVAKAGDTIVFDSVSRMSRDAEAGFDLYKKLIAQDIELVFLKEPQINTATYRDAMGRQISIVVDTGDEDTDEYFNDQIKALNKFLFKLAQKQIKMAFDQAEKEVQDLHQRTKEGIETARLNGKQIGQQAGRKLNVKKANEAKEVIRKHSKDFGGSLSDAECMKQTGVSRNTFYRYKKEIKEQG